MKAYIKTRGYESISNDPDNNLIRLSTSCSELENKKIYDVTIENLQKTSCFLEAAGIEFDPPQLSERRKWNIFIDQGACAWSGVRTFSDLQIDPHMDILKKEQEANGRYHQSDLLTVLWDSNSGEAILFGFIGQQKGSNKIRVYLHDDNNNISNIKAWQDIQISLQPEEKIETDQVVVLKGSDPYLLLDEYSAIVSKKLCRKFDDEPITGMMTWYGYGMAINEDIILRNTKIIADLFLGYPQNMRCMMLIDAGWEEDGNWGYWEPDKQRFSHGISWLSEQLSKEGIELGLWYTPFCITENAENYAQIKNVLVKDINNEIVRSDAQVWGDLPGHSSEPWPISFLDGNNDEVQKKWQNEFEEIRKWNVKLIKLDFFSLMTSENQKWNISRGDLYKKTWRNFRQSVGNDVFLAPCSCDTNMMIGYCDSIRIGTDIGSAGQWPGAWQGYRYALSTIAAQWFKHRHFWINDPDSVQIAKGCSLSEARVRISAAALSGGHFMIGEDLSSVNAERLEMIKRVLPVYPKAARPLDMFENPFPKGYPSIWKLELETGFGTAYVLAVFNLHSHPESFKITSEMIGIDRNVEFIAFEWWQYKWLGRFRGEMEVTVPSEDVFILHIQVTRDTPWMVSVSHHITSGYILEDVSFSNDTGELKGYVKTKAGMSIVLYGSIPIGWDLPRTDFHSSLSSAGSWQTEIRTTGNVTPFSVIFKEKKL